MKTVILDVTSRIRERSAAARRAYLARVDRLVARPPGAQRMGCANVAHAFAAMPGDQRLRVVAERAPNLAVVTSYNDMLSAHQPYEGYPAVIRDEARRRGATVQVAGGTPAMCDGVTQGLPGMELSLFSRDTIAMGTAIALTHDVFDAALLLGVCDKIVPGLLIGALHFGHLPTVFVPAGPMPSGLSNSDKAKVREQAAQGLVGRDALMQAEQAAYHAPGTCTFYGTANSNQMLLEAMGLHVPGTAFVNPGGALRDELTRESARAVLAKGCPPIGKVVDERAIVPRSFIAELLADGSIDDFLGEHTRRVLDLCTGNGSLAILAAMAYPEVEVTGADISADALAVARINVDKHGLAQRVELQISDGMESLPGPWDLILCNPPYVNAQSMSNLPAEYRAEPELALAGGTDGMDFIRKLLRDAPARMSEHAVLVLEIGNERAHFEAAFPRLEPVWLDTSAGDDQVLLLSRDALLSLPSPTPPAP